ncbi:MAG: hypothetical protein ATN36_07295 [Epulopiscium sp. Nele67-Bin005]|nr:MAG: hypothetical protein ATN36_07295 [Epulopiscium sp. Nele67-Bin005]
MVTIEQKLALFSKLVKQEIKEDMQLKKEEIEQEYKQLGREREEAAKKNGEIYVTNYMKALRDKHTESESQTKLWAKKQILQAEEECIEDVFKGLNKQIRNFVRTKKYLEYLYKQLDIVFPYFSDINPVVISLTEHDKENYHKDIIRYIEKNNICTENVVIQTLPQLQLGGIMMQVPAEYIQVDLSIEGILEEKRDEIIEKVLVAIEKERKHHE